MNMIAAQCKLLADAFRSQAARMKQPLLGHADDEIDLVQLADHIEKLTPVGMSFFEGFRETARQDGVTFEQAVQKFFSSRPVLSAV